MTATFSRVYGAWVSGQLESNSNGFPVMAFGNLGSLECLIYSGGVVYGYSGSNKEHFTMVSGGTISGSNLQMSDSVTTNNLVANTSISGSNVSGGTVRTNIITANELNIQDSVRFTLTKDCVYAGFESDSKEGQLWNPNTPVSSAIGWIQITIDNHPCYIPCYSGSRLTAGCIV